MTFATRIAGFIDRKLAEFGSVFQVVRPVSAANPLAGVLGTVLAYPYRSPKGHGNADWLLMFQDELPQPGDYLVKGSEIYIYGRAPLLQPAQAMRCNHTVALLRQPAGTTTGVQSYGGACFADSQAALGALGVDGKVMTGWPASILLGGRQAAGSDLPMAVAIGGFEIMLPKTVPLTILASDILLDDLGRRFIADTCELSELGWRITAKEVHA